MEKDTLFILNTTDENFILCTGGKLGTVSLKPYQALKVQESSVDTKLQNHIDRTLKKVVLCREVPQKYIKLYEHRNKGTNLTEVNNANPVLDTEE